MPTDSATNWFGLFVAACALAAVSTCALLAVVALRRRDARLVRAALQPLAAGAPTSIRAARLAAAVAGRQDAALAEVRAVIAAAPFGIVALDRLGRVTTMNPAASRMFGLSPGATTAPLLIELVRAPELDALLAAAHASGQTTEGELTFHTGGTRRVARAIAAPLASGATDTRFVVVLEDLTELRRLESVRSDFVSNVSHELRTPVTNVRGYAETLLTSFDLEPQARTFLETIQRNAVRLGAIIDDLLLLASLEGAPADSLDMVPRRVSAVIAEAVEQHADAARSKGMAIEVNCPPALAVRARAGLIGHAIGNLLENAVKYSPAGSTVHITAVEHDGRATIEVRDHGPGIPAQHLERIFERFYRVDKGRTRETGGTGLGLAIVKHVAQTHGGSVEVESRTGLGSSFRVHLPAIAPNAHGF